MSGKKITNLTVVGGRDTHPDLPDLADIYAMAYKAMGELPSKFQSFIANILIRVENFADEDVLGQLNIRDKYDLLGLYRGTPMPKKSQSTLVPDVIFLYRCPIIRFSRETEESIEELVYHVMIHEIGHHFGYNDYDIAWIENGIAPDGGRNRD